MRPERSTQISAAHRMPFGEHELLAVMAAVRVRLQQRIPLIEAQKPSVWRALGAGPEVQQSETVSCQTTR